MSDIVKTFPEKFRADIEKAIKILKEHGCKDIYIFGSLADGTHDMHSDIDIAVMGLDPQLFLKVSSKLMFELDSSFDLIELDDEENRFAQFILKQGELVKVA